MCLIFNALIERIVFAPEPQFRLLLNDYQQLWFNQISLHPSFSLGSTAKASFSFFHFLFFGGTFVVDRIGGRGERQITKNPTTSSFWFLMGREEIGPVDRLSLTQATNLFYPFLFSFFPISFFVSILSTLVYLFVRMVPGEPQIYPSSRYSDLEEKNIRSTGCLFFFLC